MIASHDDVNVSFQELAIGARTNPGRASRSTAGAGDATKSVVTKAVANEERADTIVRNFWGNNRDCCFDVTVRNLDADSYWSKDPLRILASAAAAKKKKHLGSSCLEHRHDFTPLVFSCDAIFDREALYALRCMARKMSKKWEIHYSWICGYVKARMGLNVIRSATRCLYGSRVPIRLISRKPEWSDGSGMAIWDVLNEHSY